MKIAQYAFYYMMKPFILLYFTVVFNFRIITNPFKGVKGPYLVIGHHVKTEDPLFVLAATRQLVRFLAGDANMTTLWKKVLFNAMGMVPFKKKKSDMKSIRQLMAIVKDKEAIGLYPEGGRNWDGATDVLIPSTAKLIKMLRIDVYVTFYKGAYLTKPRWADYSRRGKVEFVGHKLFDGPELKQLSVEEIMDKMAEALAYNEFDWQHEKMIPFKGQNRASGITRLLWKCPVCKVDHQLQSKGNDLHCQTCGQVYHYNEYGFLDGHDTIDDTSKWQKWQKSFIPSLAKSDLHYTLKDIRYEQIGTNNIVSDAWPSVDVTITNKTISIQTKENLKTLSINETYGFSFTLQDLFEFYNGEKKHRLIFDPTKHLSNVFIIDLVNQLKENSKHG